jgi:enediyne biosynthesis protein E4
MNRRYRALLMLLVAAVNPTSPVVASADTVRFVEVTQEAGIDFRYINGASGRKYMPEAVGSGAAFLDADGDGWLDLYIVNGAALPGYTGATGPNALFRNDGDGTFTDFTSDSGTGDTGFGMSAAVGDVDNDGDPDLYVGNYGANVLYRNDGDAQFSDITTEANVGDSGWGSHATFADVDHDGDLDLYVANYMEFQPDTARECFRGEAREYCGPNTYPGQSGVLYRNDGDLLFTDITHEAGLHNSSGRQLAAVFGDIDADGDADLFVANDKQPNFLFLNDGAGHFDESAAIAGVAYNEEGVAESAMGADIGDVDNDGLFDIIVATFQWLPNTLYRNEGGGFFSDVTFAVGLGVESVPYLGMSATFLDYDNDGWLDVFVSNGHLDSNVHEFDPSTSYEQPNQLFHNQGDGTFAEVTRTSGPGLAIERVSHGAVLGDYDNDGDTDIFVSDSASPTCTLLRNDGGDEQHHLTIRAQGTVSNRDGIGAQVRVVSGDLIQTREIRRGYGYMGSNDVRLLVGLGANTQVDTLQIRWPGGKVQTLVNIAADQQLTVEQDP